MRACSHGITRCDTCEKERAAALERLETLAFTLASEAAAYLMHQGPENEQALRTAVLDAKATLKNPTRS